MKKKLVLFVAMLCLLLSSCGAKQPKESDVIENVKTSVSNYRSALEMKECTIEESEVNEDYYYATASLSAESRYADYEMTAEVAYEKVDKEWDMTSCDFTVDHVQLNVQEEDIPSIIEEADYGKYTGEAQSSGEFAANYGSGGSFSVEEDILYVSVPIEKEYGSSIVKKGTKEQTFRFDSETGGFAFEDSDDSWLECELPDLNGTWRVYYVLSGKNSATDYFKISDFTPERFTLYWSRKDVTLHFSAPDFNAKTVSESIVMYICEENDQYSCEIRQIPQINDDILLTVSRSVSNGVTTHVDGDDCKLE